MGTAAYVGGRVLLADGLAEGTAVLVRDGRIVELRDESDSLADCDLHFLDGQILAPGFIDVQVNGGGGVLFNDAPTVAGLAAIAAVHRREGTTGLLPTLISDDLAVVAAALEAVRDAIAVGVPGVLGIHLEGPFLEPARRGIHDPRHFQPLDDAAIDLLSRPTGGVTLVTLAPECATPQQIETLCARGVRVSLGHSNASAEMALRAFDAGASGVTHLFNAMAPLLARAPGLTGAALLDPRPWCGLILDGHHVDPVTARVALRCRPHDRCLLVSDAMPCVGTHLTAFTLHGNAIRVAEGVCRGPDGTLAGSACTLADCVRVAARQLGMPLETILRMASEYPADFLGLGAAHGRIAPGCTADLIALSADLSTVTTL